jgi:hypothetical protein
LVWESNASVRVLVLPFRELARIESEAFAADKIELCPRAPTKPLAAAQNPIVAINCGRSPVNPVARRWCDLFPFALASAKVFRPMPGSESGRTYSPSWLPIWYV